MRVDEAVDEAVREAVREAVDVDMTRSRLTTRRAHTARRRRGRRRDPEELERVSTMH